MPLVSQPRKGLMSRPFYCEHDRDSFFKYMPADTAKIVLRNKTLRWSSPLEFNDPFDVPRELALNIPDDEINKALVEKVILTIENPPENTEGLEPSLVSLVKMFRTEKAAKQAPMIAAMMREMAQRGSSCSLEPVRTEWRNIIPQFRILCLSESFDVCSMWCHYADKYTGVVLELLCHDDLDSEWLRAKPVQYPEDTPDIFYPSGWAKVLSSPVMPAVNELFETCLYTKTPDWSYEKEWRVESMMREHETGTVSDRGLHQKEFGRLFLGPHIDRKNRSDILEIIQDMPHIQVYDVEIGMARNFSFQEVRNRAGVVAD